MNSPRLLLLIAACLAGRAPAPGAQLNLVANGDMSDGRVEPVAWDHAWTGSGRLVVSRDTETYNSAPAALRLASAGADAVEAQRSQLIPVAAGSRLEVEGWMRSRGDAHAVFGVQFFQDWTLLKFEQIRHVKGDEDWILGRGVVEVPAGATRAGIQLYLKGRGEAWLDDVVVAPEGARVATESPAALSPPAERTVLLLADFSHQAFDYGYGSWEKLSPAAAATDLGREISGDSSGGVGRLLQPAASAAGATHLRVLGRIRKNNTAENLVVVVKGPGDRDLARVLVPLARLSRVDLGEFTVPLPDPAVFASSPVEQFQIQGEYRSGEYIHVELAALALVSLSAAR